MDRKIWNVSQRPANEGLVKVVFDLPVEAGSTMKTESLWAEPLGEDHFRLRNVPFFSVRIQRTRRDIGKRSQRQAPGHWSCEARWSLDVPVAVDVPPHADIYAFYEALQEGENAGQWEFEEGHCGHLVTKSGSELND